MPLRLDNARALPTCPQQQTKKTFKSRFKVDYAASPMPETRQPERLPPRATSNRNGGRDHLGILGEIKSVHPGEIIGIRKRQLQTSATDINTSSQSPRRQRPFVNDDGCVLHPARPEQQALPLLAVWKNFGGLTQLPSPKLKLILAEIGAGHLLSESPAAVPSVIRLRWHVAP